MLLNSFPSARNAVALGCLSTVLLFLLFQWHSSLNWRLPQLSIPDGEHSSQQDQQQQEIAYENVSSLATTTSPDDGGASMLNAQIEFWRKFQPILGATKPEAGPPKRLGRANAVGFEGEKTKQERPNLTEMSDHDVEVLKQAHELVVNRLRQDPPELAYAKGMTGIVTTAGGKYLPVLVISLRMLRLTGSTLPMEVFLASEDEYEPLICDEVLAVLNARCVVISRITSAVPGTGAIEHYQLKVFAMLFSSFESILFLDADSFPVSDPAHLFLAEPYTNHGMVLWPDFWASSASQLFYKIASLPVPPMSARQSSETGEVLFNKATHARTLLLATYYNYYGPSYYYILLSQGAPGEGDKETFAAAADAMQERYYHVSEKILAIGREKPEGGIAGSAMVQHDPIQDYNLTSHNLFRVKDRSIQPAPRPFFVHANFPKFNPITIFHENGPTWDGAHGGHTSRAWTSPTETLDSFGFDVEMRYWEEIRGVACDLEGKFDTWRGLRGTCSKVQHYYATVFGTPLDRIMTHHEPKEEKKKAPELTKPREEGEKQRSGEKIAPS
ncbi:hypothetical protein MMC25_008211 [Agyrium rufum]|nr:hypothetical protein [Agyrium rufum]